MINEDKKSNNKKTCHAELVSASRNHEIPKQVRNDMVRKGQSDVQHDMRNRHCERSAAIQKKIAPTSILTTTFHFGKQGHKAHFVAPVPFAPQKGGSTTPSLEGRLGWVPINNVNCLTSCLPDIWTSKKKVAFTLAEVLITLGIIGIVAAMTLPALIQNYQKQVTVTKLKRFYSALSQSIELSKVEYGDVGDWDWTLDTKDFYDKYFTKKLAVVKYCAPNEAGCWNSTNKIYLINGGTDVNMINFPKMILADGTFVTILKQDNSHIHLYADFNGMKSPNMYGKDCVILTFTKGPFQDYAHNIFQAGLYFFGYGKTEEQLISGNIACARNKGGQACGLKIMKDSWQIKDDYPW